MKKLQKWLEDYCDINYSLKELEDLHALTISNSNKIETLPPEIGELENLRELYLYRNNLQTLPKELCKLKKLKWLNLENNPNLKIFESQVEFLKPLKNCVWKLADFEIIPDAELSEILYL